MIDDRKMLPPKKPAKTTIPREQFEFMLCGIETNSAIALEAASGLSISTCYARDIARQRRMNQMVENGIIQLEELSNIRVACTRHEAINSIPYPPRINHQQTMLNYDNRR